MVAPALHPFNLFNPWSETIRGSEVRLERQHRLATGRVHREASAGDNIHSDNEVWHPIAQALQTAVRVDVNHFQAYVRQYDVADADCRQSRALQDCLHDGHRLQLVVCRRLCHDAQSVGKVLCY